MKFLTFDEWIHNQPELKDDDCEECEGDGSDIDDDDEWIECYECGGTGSAHYTEYELQIKKDKKLLGSRLCG